jgi:WD40 repeat protein
LTSSRDRSLVAWDIETASEIVSFKNICQNDYDVRSMDIHPNNDLFALGVEYWVWKTEYVMRKQIFLFSFHQREHLLTLSPYRQTIEILSFSDDGTYLIAGGSYVQLWEIQCKKNSHPV